MKKQISKLFHNIFIKNVLIIALGTAGAQIITMIFSPIITRIYSPDEYGIFGLFMAIITVITPIAALTYPIAIVLPKKDNEAKKLIKLSIIISLLITFILFIILFFTGDNILNIIGASTLKSYSLIIPMAVFFNASMQIASQWLIRKHKFKTIAQINVLNSLIVNSGKTGLGLVKPIALVLIAVTTTSVAIHTLLLVVKGNIIKSIKNIKNIDISLLRIAKKYYDFPLYRAPQVFINAFSQGLPVILLGGLFSPSTAGFYILAISVLGIPSTLIGQSVADVFYPRITEAFHKRENLTKLIKKATLILAITGFFPYLIIILFGPLLFGLIFGSNWTTAGDFSRWLSLWFFFSLINSPSVASIPTLSMQKFFLFFEIISVITRLSTIIIIFFIFNDEILTIAFYSIVSVFINVLLIWITINTSKKLSKGNNI